MNRLPNSVRMLLISSLVFEMGRATALPFLAIYLTERMGLNQQQVGMMVTTSLALATLFGLYGGYLADRFDKHRLIGIATGVAALSTVAMVLLRNPWIAVLALACTDAAVSLRYVSLKASLAEMSKADDRGRVFSLNYTLINIAYGAGPLLGAIVAGFGLHWTFLGSAACALMSLQITRYSRSHGVHPEPMDVAHVRRPAFKATLMALKSDRRLVWFVFGGLLSALAYGRFSVYLSQYLLVEEGAAKAATTLPYLIATNAVTVVLLQYPLGKLIKKDFLIRWIAVGSLMFALGLAGFSYASTLPAWVLSMFVFTVGEVIVIPAEYLFIDKIAPESLKGSYYGVQSLTTFGSALNPLLCGALLTYSTPRTMFGVLIAAVLVGAAMYRAGARSAKQSTNAEYSPCG